MTEDPLRHLHPLLRDRTKGLEPAAARLLSKAASALNSKQFDAAEHALVAALSLVPQCAEAQRLLGITLQQGGNPSMAATILKQARDSNPDDPLIHMNLGSALQACGDSEAARMALERACELAHDFAPAWFNLGKLSRLAGDPQRALQALERAVEIDPRYIPARIALAEIQANFGDVAGARGHYRHVLHLQPANPEAWLALTNLKTEAFNTGDVTALKKALRSQKLGGDARISLAFALAKTLEDQADHVAAHRALGQANDWKHQRVHWNAAEARKETEHIRAAFPGPLRGAQDPRQGEEVIFVVCLPRSGSTLVEQILASHSQIEGGGELTDLQEVLRDESNQRGLSFTQWVPQAAATDWERLGRRYLARTRRFRQSCPRFTDKNLLNWRLVGAASAMLPGAHIVNVRRMPVENCLACYRQLFARGNHFSYRLEDMASYWQDYDRLCRHWQSLFPGRILEYHYESLLAEPEGQVRRLLEFCGLDYEPGCLTFHRTKRFVNTASAAQVRRPLTGNTPHAELYGDYANRLKALLERTNEKAGDHPGLSEK